MTLREAIATLKARGVEVEEYSDRDPDTDRLRKFYMLYAPTGNQWRDTGCHTLGDRDRSEVIAAARDARAMEPCDNGAACEYCHPVDESE